jgi:hypothetical protein
MHRPRRDEGSPRWELLGKCADKLKGTEGKALRDRVRRKIEEQEDEHLYHTQADGAGSFWIESLGMKAVLRRRGRGGATSRRRLAAARAEQSVPEQR